MKAEFKLLKEEAPPALLLPSGEEQGRSIRTGATFLIKIHYPKNICNKKTGFTFQ